MIRAVLLRLLDAVCRPIDRVFMDWPNATDSEDQWGNQ